MGITLDGPNKLIILDTATSFTWLSIYDAVTAWAVQAANMKYLLPMASVGHVDMGGGIFTDIVYVLLNGWKLQPSGYAANSQIKVSGTAVVSDGSNFAVAPSVGSPVQWYMQAATAGTIVSVSSGSGLSVAEHNQLMGLPAAADNASATLIAFGARLYDGTYTADQIARINDAILHGQVTNAGTGVEWFWNREGTKVRVKITVDAQGNRTNIEVVDVT
jgi:hypothetical protein